MKNPPTMAGGQCQLGGDSDPYSRNPEKCNVIRFPNERRIERIEVSWAEGFGICIAEIVERNGRRAQIAHDGDPAEVLHISRKLAGELRLPIIDKTNPPQVRVERPNRERGSAV